MAWTIHINSQLISSSHRGPLANLLPVNGCDVTVVNPLNASLILGASTTVGYSAAEKEVVKMTKNGPKCAELGWECIPLAVEWGKKNRIPAGGWQWAQPPVKPG